MKVENRKPTATLVVPCYNEAKRLPVASFLDYWKENPNVTVLFVNDGSRDDTGEVLDQLRANQPEHCQVLHLAQNQGKAEAVRQGCLAAFAHSPAADVIGYWDADLATPLDAAAPMMDLLERRPDLELVCGARVRLLGRRIERKVIRHLLGRCFATAASWTLGLPIYDTQCGAKLFRNTPRIRALWQLPFLTRWLFDVELLARLQAGHRQANLPSAESIVCEYPLEVWQDVHGSKVKPTDFPKAFLELARIAWTYRGKALPRVLLPETPQSVLSLQTSRRKHPERLHPVRELETMASQKR